MSVVENNVNAIVKSNENKSQSRWVNFIGFVNKLEKQIGGKFISKSASQQFDSFLKNLATTISSMVVNLLNNSDRLTVNHKDIETAVNLLFPINLAILATKKGSQSVQYFLTTSSKDKKSANKALRSGLIIPPYIAEKFLRMTNFETNKIMTTLSVTEWAPVYLAAVLEFISKEIFTSAIRETKTNNLKTIGVKHLQKAVLKDDDLSCLFNRLHFKWIMGGCLEYIHPSLIPDKQKTQKLANLRRKVNKNKDISKKTRKMLPGTKALKDIKKYQKTTGLLQRKEHFKRFVKVILQELTTEKINFSRGSLEYIQAYIEDTLCDILRKCVLLMIHGNRETIEAKDLELYISLFENTKDYKTNGSEHLAKPGLRRISLKAGVKRIGSDAFPVLRELASIHLYRLLGACVMIMQRESYKTITLNFLKRAGSFVGINLPFDIPPRRKSSKKPGTSDKSETQSEVDDISIPEEENLQSENEEAEVEEEEECEEECEEEAEEEEEECEEEAFTELIDENSDN